ncbi:MAG: hypothetical protein ACD_8C00044G0002 [uncultured bacterium]|nr:MAG: hypothetical protein ACD_8C00044G0002 [uncultured bacterium]
MQLDPELMHQKKKMQMDIMLKDSDLKKNEREMLAAEIAMRELKHKQAQLEMEHLAKENLWKKLSANHIQIQAELIKLKHQMNNLGR